MLYWTQGTDGLERCSIYNAQWNPSGTKKLHEAVKMASLLQPSEMDWVGFARIPQFLPPSTRIKDRKAQLNSWLHLKLPNIAWCQKQKGKKRVLPNVGKDLCNWWDYEKNIEKNGYSILLWKSFGIFSFSPFSTPLK